VTLNVFAVRHAKRGACGTVAAVVEANAGAAVNAWEAGHEDASHVRDGHNPLACRF